MTLSTVQFSISSYSYLLKRWRGGVAEERAQHWLLFQRPQFNLQYSQHSGSQLSVIPALGVPKSSSGFCEHQALKVIQRYTCRQSIHTYNILFNKKKSQNHVITNSRIAARKILRSVQTTLLFYKIRNDPKIMRTCQNKQ